VCNITGVSVGTSKSAHDHGEFTIYLRSKTINEDQVADSSSGSGGMAIGSQFVQSKSQQLFPTNGNSLDSILSHGTTSASVGSNQYNVNELGIGSVGSGANTGSEIDDDDDMNVHIKLRAPDAEVFYTILTFKHVSLPFCKTTTCMYI